MLKKQLHMAKSLHIYVLWRHDMVFSRGYLWSAYKRNKKENGEVNKASLKVRSWVIRRYCSFSTWLKNPFSTWRRAPSIIRFMNVLPTSRKFRESRSQLGDRSSASGRLRAQECIRLLCIWSWRKRKRGEDQLQNQYRNVCAWCSESSRHPVAIAVSTGVLRNSSAELSLKSWHLSSYREHMEGGLSQAVRKGITPYSAADPVLKHGTWQHLPKRPTDLHICIINLNPPIQNRLRSFKYVCLPSFSCLDFVL